MTNPESISFENLLENAKKHFASGFPFVVYKKPGSDKIVALFQADKSLYAAGDFTESGYVFAPFQGNDAILIPEKKSLFVTSALPLGQGKTAKSDNTQNHPEAQKKHLELVQKAVETINAGHFEKLVISRKETIDLPDFDFMETFKNLVFNYPTAFCYCFFHPQTQMWLGAFSELLLNAKGNELKTMSVAGTQPWNPYAEMTWKDKEKTEQELVTGFIVKELHAFADDIATTSPYTLKAGNVAHLKTDISANIKPGANLVEILSALHPTPAVCGLPKFPARDFIIANEGYDREYYSGFHGELNLDSHGSGSQTDLFVNLRCMKIEAGVNSAKATVFIGGGITKDSIAQQEWTETVNKSQTMKKIL